MANSRRSFATGFVDRSPRANDIPPTQKTIAFTKKLCYNEIKRTCEDTDVKIKLCAFLLVLVVLSLTFTGCDGLFGGDSDTTKYNDSMESSTGKWSLLGDTDTYFVFDGSNGVMTFSYFEDGAEKYGGKFRGLYRSNDDASTPLSFILTRTDKQKEDWLSCYVEGFEENFTQFSIFEEEEDLGVTDGTVYTHIYRLSELPYKLGTYVLEGNTHKVYSNAFNDGEYRISEGTYVSGDGQKLTVVPLMNRSYMLFRYENGEIAVEGLFNIAQDKKTIYLYIEHDIYEKVKNADKEHYDTTFSLNYPPDFYLRGDFDTTSNDIVINGLYHHEYSPTEIDDSVWAFGTYTKQ